MMNAHSPGRVLPAYETLARQSTQHVPHKEMRIWIIAAFSARQSPLQSWPPCRPHPTALGSNANYQHVLLISIDGMHAADFQYCVAHKTCPSLAQLGSHGINYTRTSTSRPSDSFPGPMALVTGGTPRTVGAFYDVAYDRYSPRRGSPRAMAGCGYVHVRSTERHDHRIRRRNDLNETLLNGGAPGAGLTDGGVASIDSARLIRDPLYGCNPVYPWNFVRTNTIFGAIHAAGGYTAWSDKHPSYSAVSGPGSHAGNLDDYYSPEINRMSSRSPGSKRQPMPTARPYGTRPPILPLGPIRSPISSATMP